MFFKDILELNIYWLSFLLSSVILFFLTTFLCNYYTEIKTNQVQNLASQINPSAVIFFILPIILITYLNFSTFKTYSGVVAFGYFNVLDWTSAWGFCLTLLFVFSFFSLKQWSSFFNSSSLPEALTVIFLFFYFWLLIAAIRSVFTLILYLELTGLCLIILLIKAAGFAQEKQKTSLLAILLFLWTSIVSVLLLLLALSLTADSMQFQFDLVLLNTKFQFNYTSYNVFLYLSIFLKLMITPWQALLFSFYKTLPSNSFALYLTFYYPFFLIMAPLFLTSYLFLTSPLLISVWLASLSVSALVCFLTLNQTVTLRAALGLSSLFNFFVIVSLLLI